MTNAAVVALSKNRPDLVVFRLCIMGLTPTGPSTANPWIWALVLFSHTLSVAFEGDTDVALTYVPGMPPIAKLEIRDCPFWSPFDYVKSQIQKMQPNATGKYSYSGSLDCVLKTWKAGGALKFYTEFPVYCVKIAHYVKDFIFNCGGLLVAFVLCRLWDSNCMSSIFSRVQKLKGQFGNLYVIIARPTTEQNDSFVRSYFKYGMEIGRPTFVPVQDLSVTAISL
ncbi:hypothetical protein IFM89_026738 [Coptis chinensis]|uniref:Uncharacterized protein n=1 Tax=Coptis chinensis TaxID=261450 RepID=A0A835M1T8_9MAGN|nr:hypothetical protein IFM89_026738 [Coptis chinensis]